MGLTREFRDTVKARAATDSAFREALLQEAVSALLANDVDTGKTILRDYINATVGFEKLGAVTKTSPKSLMRMFGPAGNPQAKNLFAVLAKLQKATGVRLEVKAA
ncbi:MAG: transcriptional regulator [Hyphomonas sp.]|nr:transcriptional regulator [Hyphomonas sp.]